MVSLHKHSFQLTQVCIRRYPDICSGGKALVWTRLHSSFELAFTCIYARGRRSSHRNGSGGSHENSSVNPLFHLSPSDVWKSPRLRNMAGGGIHSRSSTFVICRWLLRNIKNMTIFRGEDQHFVHRQLSR